MPSFCGVVNCGNRSERDVKSFFRLPCALNRGSDYIRKLSRLRRNKWLTAIKRADLTESKQKWLRICEDHFITGKPSDLEDVNHPDWVPSLKMGYQKINSSTTVQCERRVKQLCSELDDCLFSSKNSHDNCAETSSSLPQESQSIGTQTDLTMVDIENINKAYQNVQLELCQNMIIAKKAHPVSAKASPDEYSSQYLYSFK